MNYMLCTYVQSSEREFSSSILHSLLAPHSFVLTAHHLPGMALTHLNSEDLGREEVSLRTALIEQNTPSQEQKCPIRVGGSCHALSKLSLDNIFHKAPSPFCAVEIS